MIQNLSLHELLAEDASLFLYVALKDVGRFALMASVFGSRFSGSECGLVHRGNQLEHTPAKQLIVFVFELVINQLLWICIHKNRVDVVAQAGQLSLFQTIRSTSNFKGKVSRCPQHLVQVFSSSVSIHSRSDQQLLLADKLFNLALATCLKSAEYSRICLRDFK